MRKTLTLLAVLAGATYVLGQRAGRPEPKKKYSLYQRAALLWTSPNAVNLRRNAKSTTRRARKNLHR